MWVTRLVSITNFTVASSALCFQVFVLYPWHEELQHDFNNLRKDHLVTLQSMKADMEELRRDHVQVLDIAKRSLHAQGARGPTILERLGWKGGEK
ncbi:hypothetical protein S40285_06119 [Stachybotrys chlorohalonatus IBT 40285]|uniref:Uncharacterized protein n=1 Tax=Stachybotrys chlorohalonatus (strain IBT 40285) TaxID=1283841 RepID=A0A084QCC3_STAC4|nr:hypothetical protein S40285_06119 [Stachybotrys chlorohalonata IBT 40285]